MEFDWPNDLPEPIKFHVTFRIQNSRHYERGLLFVDMAPRRMGLV